MIVRIQDDSGMFRAFMTEHKPDASNIFIGDTRDDVPAGIIVCTLQGTKAFLKCIYVREDLRRQGIGRGLLEALIKELDSRGANRLEACISSENKDLMTFFDGIGAEAEPVCQRYMIDLNSVRAGGHANTVRPQNESVPLLSLSNKELNELDRYLKKISGYEHPVCHHQVDKKLSFVLHKENGIAVIISSLLDDILNVDFMYNSTGDPLALNAVVNSLCQPVLEEKRINFIRFDNLNPGALKVARYFAGGEAVRHTGTLLRFTADI